MLLEDIFVNVISENELAEGVVDDLIFGGPLIFKFSVGVDMFDVSVRDDEPSGLREVGLGAARLRALLGLLLELGALGGAGTLLGDALGEGRSGVGVVGLELDAAIGHVGVRRVCAAVVLGVEGGLLFNFGK